jgi:hypothetical protein
MTTRTVLTRRVLCFALFVLAACTANGKDEASVKSWKVTGRVVDDKGKAVPGAQVFTNDLSYLPSARHSSTKTDDEGKFVLEIAHRASGRSVRAASEEGRLQAATQLPYELKDDTKLPALELTLHPAREIVGSVVDEAGKPVAGAKLLVTSNYEEFSASKTDDHGRAVLRVPADLALGYVIAMKSSVGLDYWQFRRPDEPKSDPYKLVPDHSGELKFVLNGVRTITVRAVDDKDQPLAKATTYPWLIRKPNKGSQNDELNAGGLADFVRTTDDNGVAVFDFIPADNERQINFWVRIDGYCSPDRHLFDPKSSNSEVVAKLFPLVPIGGRVTFADGRPAPDIEVFAVGDGYSFDDFRTTVRTDSDGKFEFQGNPDQYYQFVAGNKEWASPGVNRIIRQGEPVDDIVLVLQPTTRVYGQITMGTNNSPMAKQYVSMYQKEAKSYYDLPESERLPNPKDSHSAVSTRVVRSGQSDDEGRFEFFVGPGQYYVISANNIKPPEFEITDQKSYEVNLHAERAESGPIKGRVVMRDKPDEGVANVKVWGMATESLAGRNLQAVTDSDGRFESTRALSPCVVYAGTADHKVAGVVRIGPEDPEVTIPVGPTAAAHGKLIDEETGLPAADRQIDFGIQIQFPGGSFTSFSGRSTTTDAQGDFVAMGLVPGEEYTFSAVMEKDGEGRPRSWRQVGKLTPTGSDVAELGELRLPKPYRPETIEQRVAKAFADPKAVERRVKSRLNDTRHSYQRVLLVIGDPTSPLVQRIYELEYDKALDGAAYNYLFVPVNTADAAQNEPVEKYLAEINVELPAAHDGKLAVLDEEGVAIGQAPLSKFLDGQTIDPVKLAGFLDALAPEMPDAEALMADAFARAKRENKRVFVQVSGPRCGWCYVLSRYLDAHQELIDKEFVYVKLDHRLQNGEAVIKRVRPKQEGGIPWMVFLDESGEPLITSDGPEGNIGYPGEPESRVQFEKMLRAGTKHLTDDDINGLIKALEKNKY